MGVVGPGAECELELVRAMASVLAHRGPDDVGTWSAPGVTLGHRRLSILDLSPAGHQPMAGAEGTQVVTYNGEIYNYVEVRSELASRGHRFRTGTDTEVLLAAFAEWGERCVDRLNGMFAFAIWDTRSRRLFAARDRFGEKPFHYVQRDGRLYFASECKALFLVPGLERRIDERLLLDFAAHRITDHGDGTVYAEIRQLPPASVLTWQDGRMTERKYWALPRRPESDSRVRSLADEVEALGDLLRDSVRLRLRADTPLGCLVSGGLDSSTIVAMMRDQHVPSEPVHVFTTQTDPPNEEGQQVAHLLARPGYVAHGHTPSAAAFWEDLPDVLWHQEQPFGDASMVAHFALMRLVRAAGVPVLLTGQGGDELFVGYSSYIWVHLGNLLGRARVGTAWRGARRAQEHLGIAAGRMAAHVVFHALPRSARRLAKRRGLRRQVEWLQGDLASRVTDFEVSGTHGPDDLHAYLLDSTERATLPGFLHYEDRNAMAHGVETRLPFLDHRLAEHLFRLPTEIKLHDSQSKWLLREIARPTLPAPIVNRQAKQGYPAPLASWLRALGSEVRAVVDDTRAADVPFVDVRRWRALVDGYLTGKHDQLLPVWRSLVTVLWARHVLRAPQPVASTRWSSTTRPDTLSARPA